MDFVRDAAASGNLQALTVALNELPNDPNRSIQLRSVISSTIHGGHFDCFELFVDSGASLDHPNAAGQRPVHLASEDHNRLNFLILLLEVRLELMDSVNGDGATPLHVAVSSANELGVEHLLNHGADTERINLNQQTPLHLACHHGFPVIVFQLLNGEADREASDAAGQRPLHFACALESSLCAELLLQHEEHAEHPAADIEALNPAAILS
ncbi:unnamed protein product [Microthlaspi erraticum]|uniref:Uncharacterized protein n=1 Tax=Microthlaspi erraticum TaxID=1685480 RepID=A0A6D2L6A0_9BRAS|nr:unnamed protein product [Microthlaspi erraticum]